MKTLDYKLNNLDEFLEILSSVFTEGYCPRNILAEAADISSIAQSALKTQLKCPTSCPKVGVFTNHPAEDQRKQAKHCLGYFLSNIINKNNYDDLDRLMDYKKIISETLK